MVNDEKINYDYSFEFYKNTAEDSTLFLWDILIDDPEKNQMTETGRKDYRQLRYEMIKLWEGELKNSFADLNNTESILIKVNKKDLWNLLIDWNKISIVAPSALEDVNIFNWDSPRVGSKFFLKNKLTGLDSVLTITQMDHDNFSSNFSNLTKFLKQS